MKKISKIFFAFAGLNFFIAYLGGFFVKFGSFPYKSLILSSGLPLFITSFANFDGAHYIRIADFGYVNYEQAFFPLYPLLVHLLNFALNNLILSGILLSLVSFFLGLAFFKKYLEQIGQGNNWPWIIIFLLVFPTSFFFQSLYTEGLFFFLCAASLLYISKNELGKGAILSIFASLCRLSGIFLFIPLLFKLIEQKKRGLSVLYLISPFLGVILYSVFLNIKFNDPLMFYHVQNLFGAHRNSSGIVLLPQIYVRYIKILATLKFDLSYWVSLFEFTTFNAIFWVLIYELFTLLKNKKMNFDRVGLNLFSLSNILLPTLTGTFSSIPRYALFSFSFFIVVGGLRGRSFKLILAVVFALLHLAVLILFTRGYFVS